MYTTSSHPGAAKRAGEWESRPRDGVPPSSEYLCRVTYARSPEVSRKAHGPCLWTYLRLSCRPQGRGSGSHSIPIGANDATGAQRHRLLGARPQDGPASGTGCKGSSRRCLRHAVKMTQPAVTTAGKRRLDAVVRRMAREPAGRPEKCRMGVQAAPIQPGHRIFRGNPGGAVPLVFSG